MSKKTYVDGDVTTEIVDVSGTSLEDIDTDDILARMGGKAGSYTEVRPDGTTVTYEVDVEEFEVKTQQSLMIEAQF